MGLRLKFNLVMAPLVAAVLGVAVWMDYGRESAVIMESHAMHTAAVGSVALTQPVDPTLLPAVVATQSLQRHLVFGVALLVLLILTTNIALHAFVFDPLDRLRERLRRMERGHWRNLPGLPDANDELGLFGERFSHLGLEIDALVGQSLRAERLAALALVGQRLHGQFEPDLRNVARIAVTLNGRDEEDMRNLGAELARTAAAMFAVLGRLDHVFTDTAERRGTRSEKTVTAAAQGDPRGTV